MVREPPPPTFEPPFDAELNIWWQRKNQRHEKQQTRSSEPNSTVAVTFQPPLDTAWTVLFLNWDPDTISVAEKLGRAKMEPPPLYDPPELIALEASEPTRGNCVGPLQCTQNTNSHPWEEAAKTSNVRRLGTRWTLA